MEIVTSPEFGQFIANVLLALVAILVPLIGQAVRGFLNSQKDNKQLEAIFAIAKTAVMAAEQAGLAGVISDKKDYAIKVAQEMLASRGITIDLVGLSAAIEAAVAEELNKDVIREAQYQKALAMNEAAGLE